MSTVLTQHTIQWRCLHWNYANPECRISSYAWITKHKFVTKIHILFNDFFSLEFPFNSYARKMGIRSYLLASNIYLSKVFSTFVLKSIQNVSQKCQMTKSQFKLLQHAKELLAGKQKNKNNKQQQSSAAGGDRQKQYWHISIFMCSQAKHIFLCLKKDIKLFWDWI